ncbi:MAG: ribonuclease III, partial [Fibrobacterota bacterium]
KSIFRWFFESFFRKKRNFRSGSENKYEDLESAAGYSFRNKAVLERALTHRSFAYNHKGGGFYSNERMEFLGDAVLDLVVTEFLFNRYINRREGHLSRIKSLIISRKVLCKAAAKCRLGDYLFLSRSEVKSGGRKRDSILADAFEAFICAVYLDGGLKEASDFIDSFLLSDIDIYLAEDELRNYKSEFLELAQSGHGSTPVYEVAEEKGPDHKKIFIIEVSLGGEILGRGEGRTKKDAEQAAARMALEKIDSGDKEKPEENR